MSDVLAINPSCHTNGTLIRDVATLGYITGRILDPTYGYGGFWTVHTPHVTACDLSPRFPHVAAADFRRLPFANETFDTVTFDPPYKLNGTPTTGGMDERYGVDTTASWQSRHLLIRNGITECERVLAPRGHLLLKCADQVSSGQVRWQTREFADHAESVGLRLVDRFDLLGGRPQPAGRRQVHARRNHSTLLVFRKGR